jgi:LysM repeat protein
MPDNFVAPSDLLVRQLRRRLWLERVCWLLLLGLLGAVHFGAVPGGRRAILITANGQPVTVVASRGEANRLLDDLKSPSNVPNTKVAFAETVTLRSVSAARNPIQSDSEAMNAIAAKIHPVVRASAIIVNGEIVLALPDQSEAVTVLSDILNRFSPPGEDVTRYFKEQVKVETRDVPPDTLYPNDEKAVARIAEASAPKGEYEVKPGDSAWKIARHFAVPLSRLGAANPEVDLNKVRLGQKLKVPGDLPPLTVIARREIQEPLGESPFAPARKIRITYENGAEVNREIIGRQARRTLAGPVEPVRRRRGVGEVIR